MQMDECRYYSVQDMALATVRFYELRGNEHSIWSWLGCNWAASFNLEGDSRQRDYVIPIECCRLMDLLLSPHYRTLYKAWRIKHEG